MSTSFIHGDEITWTLPASWPVEVRDQLGGTESGVVDEVIDGTLMVRPHGADHVIEVDPATAWHTDPHTAQLRELMTATPLDNRSVLDMVTDAQSRLALVLVALLDGRCAGHRDRGAARPDQGAAPAAVRPVRARAGSRLPEGGLLTCRSTP
jgi:hypothetical protein